MIAISSDNNVLIPLAALAVIALFKAASYLLQGPSDGRAS